MLNGIRVLVVEPHPASAKLLGILIRDAGAEVRISPTGEDALAAIGAFRPRLMTVDLMLPRMSGLALIDEITHNPLTSDIVVVAVTGLNLSEIERRVLAAGAAGCIRKPVATATFADQLAAYLGKTPRGGMP